MSLAQLARRLPGGDIALARRIVSGTFWVTLANLASRGFLMLALLLAARLLGTSGYGELGIVLNSVAMFEAVAALGMGVTATRYIAEYRHHQPGGVMGVVALTRWSTFLAGGLLALAVAAAAPWLSGVLGSADLTLPLRLGAVLLACNAMIGGNSGILAGFEAFRSLAYANLLTGFATLLLVVGGTWGYGVPGTLAGLAGAALVNLVLGLILIRRETRQLHPRAPCRLGRAELGLLLRFSLPAMLTGLMIAPVNWAVSALLVNRYGYGEMGLYAASNQWFSILLFLPGALTQVFLPVLAEPGEQGGSRLRATLRQGIRAILWVCLPPGLAVSAASPGIMALYGPEFSGAAPLLVVIAATAAVAATQNMFSNALAVLNRMWLNLAANLAWAACNIAVAVLLLRAGHGAMALCLAALAAYLVKLAITLAAMAAGLRPAER